MMISYWLRLVCLILFSVGLVEVAVALLLRVQAPALDRAMACLNARWQERVSFALPAISHLAPVMLAVVFIVPLYIHTEANPLRERVGVLCVAGTSLVAVRCSYALLRALRLVRMARPLRNTEIAAFLAGMPVRLSQSKHPLLAVRGILSPEIVVSRQLLVSATLSPEALELALAHESAHARQFDNLKLLILSSLSLSGCASPTVRRWRHVAEIAADDDAVAGSRARALLLAETLLTIVRSFPDRALPALVLPLLAREEELETRIHRLLGEEAKIAPRDERFNLLRIILLLLAPASLLLVLAIGSFHQFAECVLHLG